MAAALALAERPELRAMPINPYARLRRGMQKLVAASPALAERPELRASAALRSIDCLATRLWLDRRVACRFPANVLSGLPSLEGAGGTWFHLNDLQVRLAWSYMLICGLRVQSVCLPLTMCKVVPRSGWPPCFSAACLVGSQRGYASGTWIHLNDHWVRHRWPCPVSCLAITLHVTGEHAAPARSA